LEKVTRNTCELEIDQCINKSSKVEQSLPDQLSRFSQQLKSIIRPVEKVRYGLRWCLHFQSFDQSITFISQNYSTYW